VDIHRAETGSGAGGGHLDLAVDALLAEDGDRWFVLNHRGTETQRSQKR